jgi:hypothetical protein
MSHVQLVAAVDPGGDDALCWQGVQAPSPVAFL